MIKLPELPYSHDALSPTISEATMRAHHDKHHKKYVDETNKLAAEKGLQDETLEALILRAREEGWTKLIHNAEQAWNHAFFWNCMTPKARNAPAAFAGFRDEFVAQGTAHFGSGWVWLIADGEQLSVATTHDSGDCCVGSPKTALLVCDVWEHAYYLDYKNERERFLGAWWDSLANWEFAEAQMAAARAHAHGWEFPKAA